MFNQVIAVNRIVILLPLKPAPLNPKKLKKLNQMVILLLLLMPAQVMIDSIADCHLSLFSVHSQPMNY